jgi:hypothetical protein
VEEPPPGSRSLLLRLSKRVAPKSGVAVLRVLNARAAAVQAKASTPLLGTLLVALVAPIAADLWAIADAAARAEPDEKSSRR